MMNNEQKLLQIILVALACPLLLPLIITEEEGEQE